MEVSDYDWKLYRSLLPKWQERYMAKLNKEYIALLSENNNPSTNFWKLEKRIRYDIKSPGVAIDVRHSDFFVDILSLMNAGVISREDLVDFSKDVTDWIDQFL
ncbi:MULTISPECIES: multidrug transporter [Lactobacillus]|uniref:multidrug transporter n=1 Tax=Lactobacillus TaxID=1578 RepID=UPI0024933080|nr:MULTISPECIES: multidrug transporter [Lactobacillus]